MADDAIANVAQVLDSGYIGEGPQTRAFEAALAPVVGTPNIRVVNSGTSALWLAAKLALDGIPENLFSHRCGVAYATPLTCLATTMALEHLGYAIRWVDVDSETGGMCPKALRTLFEAATPTHALVVVCDWGGDPGHLLAIRDICNHYAFPLLEDAAHAIGATTPEGPVGSIATYTAFSFQAIKNLTTGDGGALACRHAHDAEKVRLLRWFGLDRNKGESMRCYQQVPFPGFKMQMNDIAAAIGLANLPGLDATLRQQRELAAYYDLAFGPAPPDGVRGRAVTDADREQPVRPLRRQLGSSCWLYSVRVKDARTFISRMGERGIECSQVHARNDVQQIFSGARRPLPGMDTLDRELACLPIGWWVTRDDAWNVAHTALEVARGL